MSPDLRQPRGAVTMHALPSKVSPSAACTTTPPPSPSPPRCSTFFTTTSRRISNPAARASVIWPYPPLTMQCGPPNPPYGSSWFQCAMDIFERGAEHPYSRLAQCHPSNLLSRAVSVTFSLFSPSSSPSPAPSAAASASASASSPNACSSSSSITSARDIFAVASSPSRSTRSLARSISASLCLSTLASNSSLTSSPVTPSYSGSLLPSVLSPKPSCAAIVADGSARTPSHGCPVRRFASGAHPVMMDAPMSTGTDRDEPSVCTRPPTRSRASRTTQACPCDASMRAADRPAGPAPTTITGFVGLGLAASISLAALATAALALAASSRLSSTPLPLPTSLYLSGSSRNPVTMARTTSFLSVRSAPSSASIALRICFSVVVFMSAVRRYATVRSVRSSSVIVVGLASSGSGSGAGSGSGVGGLGGGTSIAP
mmetsp:Transcript_7674/g.30322  ORF Transcript_7674/g.30322 Transcript_7674/m.30322 type:complete len:430 (+) Transcript_7674:2370-3659(+)